MSTQRPKTGHSPSERELDKAEEQFKAFDDSVKEMTMDRLNAAPTQETEMQTKMSTREMQNSKDVYLKPNRIVSSRDKFNEKFREEYNYKKSYVQFIAENKELIGEAIEIWTRPFPGMPAEEWKVPTNKPVWGPRYLAEQIKRKFYHRLKMDEKSITAEDGGVQYYGRIASDMTIQRLDAHPVNSQRKSVFLGADGN